MAVELVTNAVIHARTDLRLRLELDGTVLHIAVCDLGLRLLRSVPDELEGEGGRGLRLVEGVATAWGGPPSQRRQGRMEHHGHPD